LSDLKDISTEALQSQLRQIERSKALLKARASLLDYIHYVQPDTEDVDDVTRSAYVATPLARLLCEVYEKVERGELMRVAISTGPQLGKSEVVSRKGPTWYSGRNPTKHIMLGAYNSEFASEFGGDVRNLILNPLHKQVFPQHDLLPSAKGKEYMITTNGGKLAFIGVGGSGTGKPADLFIVDDPIRNAEDAESAVYRDKVWNWFNKVVFTRCHSKTPIIVCLTRWHDDDLLGRLCDPDHPERNGKYKGIAENWTYFNVPSVVTDPDQAAALGLTLEVPTNPKVIEQFGEQPMASLWADRKGLPFLAEARNQDARGFDALYMGKPSPDDGVYFTAEMLSEYDRRDLPKNLRKVCASDHAVGKKQRNDPTLMVPAGIDEKGDLWILEDVFWKRAGTDVVVENMLRMMKKHQPDYWWAGEDHITKSIGPFLRARMREERIYIHLSELSEQGDKEQKAQAIKGRMAMRKVHFPRYASWYRAARAELLKFPFAVHDEWADVLGNFGRGLLRQVPAKPQAESKIPRVGTFAWMKWAGKQREIRQKRNLNGL
jgi:phage terminase large subunit-like protein